MKNWIVVIAVVLSHMAIVLIAVSPGVVTYAKLPPVGVACSGCSTAEVQAALGRAAAAGRAQIQGLVVSHSVWVIALALFNVTSVLFVLFARKWRPSNAV